MSKLSPAPICSDDRPARTFVGSVKAWLIRFAASHIHFVRVVFVSGSALAIAAVTGLGSAYFITQDEPPFGAVRVGSWVAWPEIGSVAIDPYARAVVARKGALSLGSGEGLAFTATHDSNGRSLNGRCTYIVRGSVPVSRVWTLTIYDNKGGLQPNAMGRNGFTSHEVVRSANGMAEFVLSPDPQPGNWLMLPKGSGLQLVLRLYGTTVSTMTGAVENSGLPIIDRQSCS